jgi:hypothetical protein
MVSALDAGVTRAGGAARREISAAFDEWRTSIGDSVDESGDRKTHLVRGRLS